MLKWLERPDEAEDRRRFTFIDAFAGGRQMSEEEARELVPHLVVAQDSYQVAGPLAVAQRMLRNLISIGASRSNSYLRDPSYGLLRSSLELMLILNTSDTMQYGFMLSRVYLQLSINHEDVMSMLQDYRDIPGIGDQVDYLMNACQVQPLTIYSARLQSYLICSFHCRFKWTTGCLPRRNKSPRGGVFLTPAETLTVWSASMLAKCAGIRSTITSASFMAGTCGALPAR